MICPLCHEDLEFKNKSLIDPDYAIYFCTGCPMVYSLRNHHEGEMLKSISEILQVFGGRLPVKETK